MTSIEKNFAIILAAGASTRMGTCKASLAWLEGKTLLSYQVEQWLIAGITPIVVLGSHNAHHQNDCPQGSRVVINSFPSQGKTSSILTGLRLLPQDFEVVAVSAVDQPRSTEVYQKLLKEHSHYAAMITAPSYKGRLGHPLFFSNKLLPYLENIREETAGLRQVVQEFYSVIQKVEFDTPDVLADLNTPESYKTFLEKQNKN
jgi:molybdenum cofactor cytidylyltransferase